MASGVQSVRVNPAFSAWRALTSQPSTMVTGPAGVMGLRATGGTSPAVAASGADAEVSRSAMGARSFRVVVR